MPKKRSALQRSVATQSTDFEAESRPARLIEKPGFRNLLHQSVTVASQENEVGTEDRPLHGDRKSRSVQAVELAQLRNAAYSSDSSRRLTSDLIRVFGTSSTAQGTSSMMPATFSSISGSSQMNELYLQRQEGSLAVVYSYENKGLDISRSSNFADLHSSQGSRRFSDETVILIEDYQSYDYTNAARRQDPDFVHSRSIATCCKARRSSLEILTRPLPVQLEYIEEKDETYVCRICHEGEDNELLLQPCLCKGSVGNVHARCLKIWLEQSNTSRCELCNYPYAILQTKKYPKTLSIKVFFKTVVDKRALVYDIVSFVVITPLTLVGIVMCIQASMYTTTDNSDSNFQMGNITKAGMFMLSGTMVVAYSVWVYTLLSFYFKAWRKWYNNCYDVEVLPVRLTSEERVEAARRLSEEMARRQGSTLLSVLQTPSSPAHNFYRRVSVSVEASR